MSIITEGTSDWGGGREGRKREEGMEKRREGGGVGGKLREGP